MRVRYAAFESGTRSWESLFEEAAAFATAVGPDRLIGISQSEGRDGMIAGGVVAVWYWDDEAGG